MYYDKEKLLETADPYTVAEYIGLDMKRIGGRISILCPSHEKMTGRVDNNFGNCVLTDHGYHCFACGASGDVIQMVRDALDVSYIEALSIIADSCGGAEDFMSDDIPVRPYFPFSKEDLKNIGLEDSTDTSYEPVNAAVYGEEVPAGFSLQKHYYDTDDGSDYETLVMKRIPRQTLAEFYSEDPEAFQEMVCGKAEETRDWAKMQMEELSEHPEGINRITAEISKSIGYDLDPALMTYEMQRHCQTLINSAENILSSF